MEEGLFMSTWKLKGTQHHFLICNGSSCMRQMGEEVTQAIREEISALGADAHIHTTRTRCNGRCEDSCVVIAYPEGIWYKHITPELGRELIRQTVVGHTCVSQITHKFNHADKEFVPVVDAVIGMDKSVMK
jgi:(2Fe-2S) ferredoxin